MSSAPNGGDRQVTAGPTSSLVAFGFRKTHQVMGQIRILTGTNAEHQRAVAILCDIGVAHRAVEIDTLACAEGYGRVKLQVHFNAPFQDKYELLALVSNRFSKLGDASRMDAGDDRDHTLLS